LRYHIVARKASTSAVKIVVWEQDGGWLGHFQDYPDYWTQGETLDDLRDHLRELYADLIGGEIPGIRKVEELIVP
jgi:predicted RNase H-like HicB family nuclease